MSAQMNAEIRNLSHKNEKGGRGTMDGAEGTKAHNDHNVYILGAGFSAEAGLPLVRGFMNKMRDAAAWLEAQGERDHERKAIEQVLRFRLSAASAAYRVPLNVENVEELFSLASASGDDALAKAMPTAIAATLDYAVSTASPIPESERFDIGQFNVPGWVRPNGWQQPSIYIDGRVKSGELKGVWSVCPPYSLYVGIMCSYFNEGDSNRRDTIISFNYDTIVEDALSSLGIGVDYGIAEELIRYDNSAKTP